MPTHAETVLEMLATGSILRPRDFRRSGIPNVVVKRLLERGLIQKVGSNPDGLLLGYALAGPPVGPEDVEHNRLAEIAVQHPAGVLCLQSALRYYNYTDEFQAPLHIAIRPGANHHASIPNLKFVRWSRPEQFELGVVPVSFGGVAGLITDPPRTVADIFQPGRDFGTERMKAMSMLAEEHGSGALNKSLFYATRLGWGKEMQAAVQGFMEGWRCNRGHLSR